MNKIRIYILKSPKINSQYSFDIKGNRILMPYYALIMTNQIPNA